MNAKDQSKYSKTDTKVNSKLKQIFALLVTKMNYKRETSEAAISELMDANTMLTLSIRTPATTVAKRKLLAPVSLTQSWTFVRNALTRDSILLEFKTSNVSQRLSPFRD